MCAMEITCFKNEKQVYHEFFFHSRFIINSPTNRRSLLSKIHYNQLNSKTYPFNRILQHHFQKHNNSITPSLASSKIHNNLDDSTRNSNQPTLNAIKPSHHNLHKTKTQKQRKNQHNSFTHHCQLLMLCHILNSNVDGIVSLH
jgi:hypothetical protein